MPPQPVLTPFVGAGREGHLIAKDKEKFSISICTRVCSIYTLTSGVYKPQVRVRGLFVFVSAKSGTSDGLMVSALAP